MVLKQNKKRQCEEKHTPHDPELLRQPLCGWQTHGSSSAPKQKTHNNGLDTPPYKKRSFIGLIILRRRTLPKGIFSKKKKKIQLFYSFMVAFSGKYSIIIEDRLNSNLK